MALNCIINLFLVLIAMGLIESGSVQNFRSIGFFCGDPKISYKYNGETVGGHVLMLVTIIVPCITVSGKTRTKTYIFIRTI